MAAVIYLDGVLIFAKTDNEIVELVDSLRKDFDLKLEGTVYLFLGMKIKLSAMGYVIYMPGLSERILKTMSLVDCNETTTLASTTPPLCSFPDSPPHDKELWNYASVVGVLLYSAGNMRLDLLYAVHQAARFSHDPKIEHGEAVKRVGCYIKGSIHEGIHLKASAKLTLDANADASFAGHGNVENAEDPISVKSRIGYVITLAGCPLTWKSKLQSLIAVSTMEA